jgi:hypothetical protein
MMAVGHELPSPYPSFGGYRFCGFGVKQIGSDYLTKRTMRSIFEAVDFAAVRKNRLGCPPLAGDEERSAV